MSPEEFRQFGHQTVDWMADYLAGIREYPVLAQVEPGDLTAALPASAPETGEPMERILEDFRRLIVPGITHWNHPRFLGYFAISGSPPGILAEMLVAALNVNGMLWKSSPAVTELEQAALGWLRQWLGLPDEFFGVIYDTASTSTMHAVAAAREMAGSPRGPLTLYCSEHAHSSVDKAALTIGIAKANIRKIPADGEFRLIPRALAEAVEADSRAGLHPFCAVATVGTTATASVDPVADVVEIAEKHGMWVHVDAAYGGAAAIVPGRRDLLAAAGRAHSLVMNPHKWLLTPVDLSAFYTRRPDVLRAAFSLIPEYLRTREDPRAVNLMDYGMQLGRRFRALKLWFVMRYYGREGLAAIVAEHCRLALLFAGWVRADARFQVCAPVHFSLVCFRYRGSNQENQRLLDRLNASGLALLSHTVLNGEFVLRLAIGNWRTSEDDLRLVWDKIRELASAGG